MPKNIFNPIKEDKSGVQAKRTIWSSHALDLAITGLTQGRKLVANPFYEGNAKLLKGDLVYERTPEEIEEWKHCKKDILYFVEKYCKLMTPEGIKHIQLRDYQKDYLEHLTKSQLSIMLSARQAGKCISLITKVLIKVSDDFLDKIDDKLKNRWKKLYYIEEYNAFLIPIFEIYNIYDNRYIWKIKYQLYKLLYKLTCREKEHRKKIHGNV